MAKVKTTMPAAQKSACAKVIHTATSAAVAAGLIPIAMADTVPITAAQVTMVIALGKIFDISLSKATAQSIIGATMTSQAGRAIFANIIKAIPGAGSVIGGIVSAGTSATLTETLGWVVAEDFYKMSIGDDDSVLDSVHELKGAFSGLGKKTI